MGRKHSMSCRQKSACNIHDNEPSLADGQNQKAKIDLQGPLYQKTYVRLTNLIGKITYW